MFSSRVPADRLPNRLSRAITEARAADRPLIDLTVTNPTRAAFNYPASLLQPLIAPQSLRYAPEPFGSAHARAAVAADYARKGLAVDPDHIVLTASTSEAYSLLFKLLCNPGDAVLVPVPSYPLFDHLTRLDAVRAGPYRLEYHGRWVLHVEELDRARVEQCRAVLAVSPNNPTGSVLSEDELRDADAWCAGAGLALIVDEVFADYPLPEGRLNAWGIRHDALTFRLGGLSKAVGLPQLKLGWIVLQGPADLVNASLDRLELICDTYLSVGTPVQVAADALLESGAKIRKQIQARTSSNYDALRRLAAARPEVDVLHADGGWSAVLRVPSTRTEEDLILDLLEHDGVLVHPGYFFDFPQEAFVVVSLLPESRQFADGIEKVLERTSA
jgi:aspartate/methionine/tyrosine aminotransferase